MTLVGISAILLCLAALPFFPPARESRGFLLFLALFAAHVGASIFFCYYSLTTPSDSTLYYHDSFGLRRSDFEFGTIFVIKLVQWMKLRFGGTYLDYFLLFQVAGFWGILLLQRCLASAEHRFGLGAIPAPYWLLFLPGLHFWTAFIGKDAPLFLGVSLAVWSMMGGASRRIWFVPAVVLMCLFRPHIALLATMSLAFAATFGSRTSSLGKAALVLVTAAGVAIMAATVNTSLGVDVSSPTSIANYLEKTGQATSWLPTADETRSMPFLFKLFSLLFRPLFIDANSLLGIVASFENLVMLFVFGFMTKHRRALMALVREELHLRFSLVFAVGLILLLSITYYNLGLGIRQRVMMYPALFTVFAAQWVLIRSSAYRTAIAAGGEARHGAGSEPADAMLLAGREYAARRES